MTPGKSPDLHGREALFHDEWAASTPLDQILVRECFESPTAMENQFILSLMGSLQGKRVLDVGAGLGESSVYFALLGGQVTAVDISPRMVETAMALARRYGTQIEGIVSSGEDLRLPPDTYDIVYVANAIHHVEDRTRLLDQIYNALKPGGRLFTIDPVAYNPVINIYRRMAMKNRTEDESPLRLEDIALVKRYFPDLRHREFWLTSLLLFIKYYLVDRVHPDQDRYWKRILRETPGNLRWWMPLRRLDSILTRLPLVRYLSWNVVMWGSKPS
ncbi:MAG TPA: class I SAM-dependent methyltransferase [Bryobacteraceae bacterium]